MHSINSNPSRLFKPCTGRLSDVVGSRAKGEGIGTPALREMREGEKPRGLLGQGSASKAKDGVPLGCFRLSECFFSSMKIVKGDPGAAARSRDGWVWRRYQAPQPLPCPRNRPTDFGPSSKGRCGKEANERARCLGTGEAPLCPWPAPHRAWPGVAAVFPASQPRSPQQMWVSDHPASASLPRFHTVFPD